MARLPAMVIEADLPASTILSKLKYFLGFIFSLVFMKPSGPSWEFCLLLVTAYLQGFK